MAVRCPTCDNASGDHIVFNLQQRSFSSFSFHQKKNEIAKAVEEELEKAMSAYGFEILQTLIVDTEPDEHVKQATSGKIKTEQYSISRGTAREGL
ncbi:uncharacterized protein LOC103857021 [Brassica rapa]|uniref:uncharacterized protein LOC103857021 n=1 Tax=Brassica campestris TaxID=3711 RepID=UPI00142DFA0F|nr:uncharacterized protein LOC103857021 [Brassica rapa]